MNQELFPIHNNPTVAHSLHTYNDSSSPLPHRMRPKNIEYFFGQEHLLAEGKLLKRMILSDKLQSAIFFGPAGCGKTTLAHIIATITNASFIQINAVDSNSQELRKIIVSAEKRKKISPLGKTILFIDEIHRFNKAQQDILMPVVENGVLILIGATTHNPSFSIIGPLLSRSMLFELHPLSEKNLYDILLRAIHDPENGFGKKRIIYAENALKHIVLSSRGDARRALLALEIAINSTSPNTENQIMLTLDVAVESVQKKVLSYDKDGDCHYDTISAFIKSIRGSDPDAAVYWLAVMIDAGEDPLFIARRLVILASEDIGNADPHALQIAVNALQALQLIGMPEGRIVLAHAVLYLAASPKSNSCCVAIENALTDIRNNPIDEVPRHLRDSHYFRAKEMGNGIAYKYPHDYPNNYVPQEYTKNKRKYYNPTDNGYEKTIKQRLLALQT